MSPKMKSIVGWILSGCVGIVFAGSAMGKLFGDPSALEMAASFGLNPEVYMLLGVVELVSLVLFVVPRTGVLGTLLLTAYLGGAIATHLEHEQSVLAPCLIQAFLWCVAVFRFPELRSRLFQTGSEHAQTAR